MCFLHTPLLQQTQGRACFQGQKLQHCLNSHPLLTMTPLWNLNSPLAGPPTLFCARPQDETCVKKLAERMPDIGRKMEYLLNTGAHSITPRMLSRIHACTHRASFCVA